MLLQSKTSFWYFMFVVSLFTIGFTFSCIILSIQNNKTSKLNDSDESWDKIENLNEEDEEQNEDIIEEPHPKHKQHTLEEYSVEETKLWQWFKNPKWKVLPLFILTWFAGFASSISSTFTRSTWGFLLSEPPKNSTSNFDNIASFVYLSMGPIMVVAVFLTINKSLQYFETIYVVPMFKASVLLNNILSGGIFLKEFGEYDAKSLSFFLVGIFACLLGILMLLFGKGKNNNEESNEIKFENQEIEVEELPCPIWIDEEISCEFK